jgi:anti-sigma regulatory factor (Ser/Thr protein kinase)
VSNPPTSPGVNWSSSRPEPAEMLSVPPFTASVTLPNRPDSVRAAVAFMMQTAKALEIPEVAKPLFEVALTEAVSNAVKHGNGGEADAVIVCEVERSPRQLVIRVSDSGRGFVVPDPSLPSVDPQELQALPESGYGLPIIQTVFPSVRGIQVNGRFTLELVLPLG